MFKNTINKAFQKEFDQIIWKIEIDTQRQWTAVETRDPDSTIPTFHLLDFSGKEQAVAFTPNEKRWTMDSVQDGKVILKMLGDTQPVQEGIIVLDCSGRDHVLMPVWTSYAYILHEVHNGYLEMRPRGISQGMSTYLSLDSLTIVSTSQVQQKLSAPPFHISFPIPCPKVPVFLPSEDIHDQLWVSPIDDRLIWCYHHLAEGKYTLILGLSDDKALLDRQVIFAHLPKMLPQPYFQVGHQLFFLSYNKREIISYLV